MDNFVGKEIIISDIISEFKRIEKEFNELKEKDFFIDKYDELEKMYIKIRSFELNTTKTLMGVQYEDFSLVTSELKENIWVELINCLKITTKIKTEEKHGEIDKKVDDLNKKILLEYIFIFGIFVAITIAIFENMQVVEEVFKEEEKIDFNGMFIGKFLLLQIPILFLLVFMWFVALRRSEVERRNRKKRKENERKKKSGISEMGKEKKTLQLIFILVTIGILALHSIITILKFSKDELENGVVMVMILQIPILVLVVIFGKQFVFAANESEGKTKELETKELKEKTKELKEKTKELEEKTKELKEKTKELEEKTKELETKELETKELETKELEEKIKQEAIEKASHEDDNEPK